MIKPQRQRKVMQELHSILYMSNSCLCSLSKDLSEESNSNHLNYDLLCQCFY